MDLLLLSWVDSMHTVSIQSDAIAVDESRGSDRYQVATDAVCSPNV